MPGAPTVDKLWEVLEKGINTVTEIPMERFNISEYIHPSDKTSKRAMKAHTGNFIGDPSLFDAKFFKISPREAKSMDPQQRILLHTAYEALENAGYVPDATSSFQKDSFGCYIGVATDDYVQNLRHEIDVYYSTGTLRAFLSGRISYAMGWSGPSIVVDTACSSSLVSVYQACRALSNGDCTAALAGGVNVITSPDLMIGLDRAHFLSPTGQCKPFDASADGYSRSEGCGLFVLKRLPDALAEHDNILGVIRGVEVNQSGNAHSITHPHASTQVRLFERLLAKSGVDSCRVNVIEAHGTGTQAGDPNELESIRRTFSRGRSKSNPLHVTSVKANIGHLEAASGAAGLAKLLLMLRHRAIPQLISLKKLNPSIAPLDSDHTVIDTIASPWSPSEPGTTRISMLNNFGAAGSNGALLLEEHVPIARSPATPIALPFCLSAKDSGALNELRQRYIEFLRLPANENQDLLDVAYTMTARRQIYPCRMAVTASTRQELIDKLQQASPVDARITDVEVAFVFSGQGGQYFGMGAEVYNTSSVFKTHLDECRSMLLSMGFNDILSIISSGTTTGLSRRDEIEVYQTAVFSLEYSLAQLWMSWGLKPKVVIGHSLGEYAALVIAGVMDLRSALFVIVSRVRLMLKRCPLETTGMMAVNNSPSDIAVVLASSASLDSLSIACYNSASDCVVAGPKDQLRALKSHLDSEVRCKSTILDVPFGYHSAAMNPIVKELDDVLQTVPLRAPTIPIVSNVYGRLIQPGDASIFTPQYFSRHCAEPVKFAAGFEMLLADVNLAVEVWIELGPHPTTLPMMQACSSLPKNTRLLPSLRKNRNSWTVLASSLCSLYEEKSSITWRNVYEDIERVTCIDLPSYPFAPQKYWVEFEEDAPVSGTAIAPAPPSPADVVSAFSLLRSWAQRPTIENGNTAIFEVPIGSLSTLISGHLVGEHPLCPASVYHELAMAAIHLATEAPDEDSTITLQEIEYLKPLVYVKGDQRILRSIVCADDGRFSISSLELENSLEQAHCSGKFAWQRVEDTSQKFFHHMPILRRDIAFVIKNEAEAFSKRTMYEVIFPRVVHYTKTYHSVRTLSLDPSGMESRAIIKVPHSLAPGSYVVHPVFMDTLLHVAGFVANHQAASTDAYICKQVDSVQVLPALVDPDGTYEVYSRNIWLKEEGLMLADAYAVTLGPSPRIVAHLKGMRFQKVRLTSLKRFLNLAQGGSTASHSLSTFHSNPLAPAAAPSSIGTSRPPKLHGSSILDEVQKIVAETCGLPISGVDTSADLVSLGVDSLMTIEISTRLQTLFPAAKIHARDLPSLHTVADIAAEITSRGDLASTPIGKPSVLVPFPSPAISAQIDGVDVVERVQKVIAETCDLPPSAVDISANLTFVGVDSLMKVEILSRLQALFPDAGLDGRSLSSLNTVSEIVAELSSREDRPVPPSASSRPNTPESSGTGTTEATINVDANDQRTDLKSIVAGVLGIDSEAFTDDADLESLGLDSLTSIELTQLIQDAYSVLIPQELLASSPTVRLLNDFAFESRRITKAFSYSPPSSPLSLAMKRALALDQEPAPLVRSDGSASPLYLIHDGSGLVNHYSRISTINRTVWGIFNPNFLTSVPWPDLQSMAAKYATIISRTSTGPFIIGGWSFGGVVAYEAARQMMAAGGDVRGVLLIDSPSPINHVPLSSSLIDAVVNTEGRPSQSEVHQLVKNQFRLNSRMLGKYHPSATGPHPPLILLRSSEGLELQHVDVPSWLSDRSDSRKSVAGWEQLTGAPVTVIDIPGNHFEPFMATNIACVSQKIAEACAQLEGQS
ncbi:polyketide beta-ketoacyl-synthase [Marasmius crinis-equi]|uniref:Polyketide beta-ketoacyl-synthase n=1 Tax=Marasmius crinis-equi TaxID=585013 RepID=A0ABR3FR85_9AGAR